MADRMGLSTEVIYQEWKRHFPDKSWSASSENLAEFAGKTRQTVYKWYTKQKWLERYERETAEVRASIEKEIQCNVETGYKLIFNVADEMTTKLLIKVKSPTFIPTLDEVIKINELREKIYNRLNQEKALGDNKADNTLNVKVSYLDNEKTEGGDIA